MIAMKEALSCRCYFSSCLFIVYFYKESLQDFRSNLGHIFGIVLGVLNVLEFKFISISMLCVLKPYGRELVDDGQVYISVMFIDCLANVVYFLLFLHRHAKLLMHLTKRLRVVDSASSLHVTGHIFCANLVHVILNKVHSLLLYLFIFLAVYPELVNNYHSHQQDLTDVLSCALR